MQIETFNLFLWAMIALAAIVFVVLFFVNAGYGIFRSAKWGMSIPNKVGWVIMEAPVPVLIFLFWRCSDRFTMLVPFIFFLFLQLHYVRRAFIFPFLLRGKSRMPIGIMLMGVTFNILNAFMQGYWIFHLSPPALYADAWLHTPQFIGGTILFLSGFLINVDSDRRVRNLRKAGDTKHYLPRGGMFKYVTSANYFGELLEWTGFAIAIGSMAGWVFVIWSFANLVPRANAIYRQYQKEFADEMQGKNLKRIFPFIY
jgi:3-oxo-5-alpha-steroid 4-dehydrogenase 1